jgi:CPA1 family monovalent cation:H+ antiporter
MDGATFILAILVAGLGGQWLAARLGMPAIILLIGLGLLLGPVSGVLTLAMPQSEVIPLIGLGVAVILFEGGMDLKIDEARRVGHGIGRLTLLGPPVAWGLGTVAAHYVAGLGWPVALVVGAILVVTGPTVIIPLLRQARLNNESGSLLKWEGIVNDPVGVLLAVLVFQYFTSPGTGPWEIVASIAGAMVAALVLGGVGGWVIGRLFRAGAVPDRLKPSLLLVLVLGVFWLSNLVQHEAGLLSVTVMGLVVGNMRLVERESLVAFKENLSVMLLSVLFIVIPLGLEPEHLSLVDLPMLLFVGVIFLVRPLTIALVTIGAPMRWQDKVLLGWIAPRGIVAAATAGLFGPTLVASGYPEAAKVLPLVFLVILATVLAHGLSIGFLARRLGLSASGNNGLLIIGASAWSRALAKMLRQEKVNVMIADASYERLKGPRMDGSEVYFGDILSDEAEHALEAQHLSYMLCATDNDHYNALICKAKGSDFGLHRTFQLPIQGEPSKKERRLALQQRGYTAFDAAATFSDLDQRLNQGWTFQATRLTAAFGWAMMKDKFQRENREWIFLGGINPSGKLRLHSVEHSVTPKDGWTVLAFAAASLERPNADP